VIANIDEAYQHFESLHGGATPIRTHDDLRMVIYEVGYTYETLDQNFWDILFSSGWAWGEVEDLPVAIVRDYAYASE